MYKCFMYSEKSGKISVGKLLQELCSWENKKFYRQKKFESFYSLNGAANWNNNKANLSRIFSSQYL